jgi:DNA-binding XRE family transcriptional regulator
MNTNHYDPEKLKRLRAEKSLRDGVEITQQMVADALNVQRQTIYRAENGLDISYERLCQLAGYYGVSVITLLHPMPNMRAVAA